MAVGRYIMSTGTTKAPNLPIAPKTYSADYLNRLCNILRLYFNNLDNPGPCAASTDRKDGNIISGFNFSQVDSSGVRVHSLPTEADLANLKVGDVYVDTTASNVLKIKI